MLWISALISGLGLGSMYGLMALGFHITYAVSATVNFAQGSSMMLGAVLTYAVQRPGVDQPLKFDVTPVYNTKSGMLRSGVIGTGTPTLDIAAVDKKFTPTLEAAGVKKGMVITAVNGKPVQTYAEFHRLFVDNPTQPKIVRFSDPPGLPNSDSPAIATYARGHDGDRQRPGGHVEVVVDECVGARVKQPDGRTVGHCGQA